MKIQDKINAFCEGFPSHHYFPVKSINKSSLKLKTSQVTALSNCLFEDDVRLNSPSIAGYGKSFAVAYSYMGSGGYIKNCFIGRYCSIGRRCTIGAGFHNMNGLSTSPAISKKKTLNPITIINNDVWIGDGSIILAGINIGTGSVIGANAVVTKNVAPYSVVVGVPAKHIKYRIPEVYHQTLLESDWWEIEHDVLAETKSMNIEDSIKFIIDNSSNHKFYDTYQLA